MMLGRTAPPREKPFSIRPWAAVFMALAMLGLSMPASAARPTGDFPAAREQRGGLPSKLILRVQKALAELGLYQGPQDGRLDFATKSAVQAYQRGSGIKDDGRITEELVENLENSLQIRVLLRRLDKVRIENMSVARQALLSHPATRDLVTGPKEETADPTRDNTQCLETPTVRCLLNEALESSKAVFKPELRDWALGEILVAQARAGLGEAAMETAGRIRDPRLIVVALRDIAEAQAASGFSGKALSAAEIIPDPVKQAEALAAIADIQVNRGDGIVAHGTAEHLLQFLDKIEDSLTQVSLKARAAVILARAGDGPQAQEILTEAEAFARKTIHGKDRSVALRHVAKALAETEHLVRALTILSDVPEDSNRTPVLITTATQQALAGDAAAALVTADTIESVRYRAVVLGRIALAQADAGDLEAAEVTLEMALAAIQKIKLPFARSYAVSRVSVSMAGIGKLDDAKAKAPAIFEKATKTAQGIDDNRLRAHTLWTIAAEQVRAGLEDRAGETRKLAEQATAEIKSTLSRVWMFSEIASVHAQQGEDEAAWEAFDHGHRVAQAIDNPWGRARAFGRLAATLIELVDPGKGLPSEPQ